MDVLPPFSPISYLLFRILMYLPCYPAHVLFCLYVLYFSLFVFLWSELHTCRSRQVSDEIKALYEKVIRSAVLYVPEIGYRPTKSRADPDILRHLFESTTDVRKATTYGLKNHGLLLHYAYHSRSRWRLSTAGSWFCRFSSKSQTTRPSTAPLFFLIYLISISLLV